VDERKYILIDPEELELAEPESGRTIDVHEFVKPREIDPVFIERTYYLEPDASNKTYGAFAAALKEMDACGICTWVMRKRAYLGAVQSHGKTLRLNVLRYADEIVRPDSLALESFELSEKEVSIGGELINKFTVPFQPEKYVDEHQKKLMEMIVKKAHGKKIAVFAPKHLKPTSPGKLLETLEKSLKRAA
jgi:DNA end-binding protein Ku